MSSEPSASSSEPLEPMLARLARVSIAPSIVASDVASKEAMFLSCLSSSMTCESPTVRPPSKVPVKPLTPAEADTDAKFCMALSAPKTSEPEIFIPPARSTSPS